MAFPNKKRKKVPKKSEAENEKEKKKIPINPSEIKNKMKRNEVRKKQKIEKKKAKETGRQKRKEERKRLGDEAPPIQPQWSIDKMRVPDETIVLPEDEEVLEDEGLDEFSEYFKGNKTPKIFITTSMKPSQRTLRFVSNLLDTFPNLHYYARKQFPIKKIIEYCNNRDFTDVIVIHEDHRMINSLLLTHLPEGPTARFRLGSIRCSKQIRGHAESSEHHPEVILNNFVTRLGHSVGRMLGALFPIIPNFHGRKVATFHNQRDYIFFRHHRYIFESKEKVRLQEIGPRFCLKLQTLQKGLFDPEQGEFEFIYRNKMAKNRRKFVL